MAINLLKVLRSDRAEVINFCNFPLSWRNKSKANKMYKEKLTVVVNVSKR